MSGPKHDKRDATIELVKKAQQIADDVKEWKSASEDATKELVENLKEAIRQIQRYLVSSLMAAGAFAALAWAPADVVQVDAQLPVPIPRAAALLLLGAVYVVTGLLASLTLARANHLSLLLTQSKDLLLRKAVLLYPSIPTMRVWGLRIGLCLLPPVFVVAGMVKIFGNRLLTLPAIFGVILLCIAPIVIAHELREALGGEPPDFHHD